MAQLNLDIPVLLRKFAQGDADLRLQPLPDDWDDGQPRRYGVQFVHSLRQEERQDIQAAFGLALDAYVPKFAYIELVTKATLQALFNHALVNGVFPYGADHKRAPRIGSTPKRGGLRRRERPNVLLRAALFPEADVTMVAGELESLGAERVQQLDPREKGGAARVEFNLPNQSRISELTEIEEISWLEEIGEAKSDGGALLGFLESGQDDCTPIFDSRLRGQRQVIGIIDDGVLNYAHCWFRDDSNDNRPRHDHRKVVNVRALSHHGGSIHANFVAGILAGDDVHNPGSGPHRGFACDAQITYGNRFDFEKEGDNTTLYDYLVDAATDGAFVHNNSWHFEDDPQYSMIAHDVDRFAWEFEECLVVASSGNRGEEPGPPGSAKNTLCVSAAYVGKDANDAVVRFFGDGIAKPTDDGRQKPDLLVPGCAHVSADDGNECATRSDETAGAETAPAGSGIPPGIRCAASYATPVAAAAAAIARQYFVEGRHPSVAGPPTGALLKAALLNATAATDSGFGSPNVKEGWGLLQLDRALPLLDAARKLWLRDVRHPDGLTTGTSHEHTVDVASGDTPLKVTLVWTDPPGQTFSSRDPVVNNLDLEVIAPGGTRYLGNRFDPVGSGESLEDGSATDADQRNNVEMVIVTSPAPGPWTIVVRGTEVNVYTTGQGYALAASADLA